MAQDLETRVVKIEVTQENHAEDIKELRETSVDMKSSLHSIEKNLAQIKYLALGALAVVLAQSVGLDKALKLLLGS
jgi:hypothetical protein